MSAQETTVAPKKRFAEPHIFAILFVFIVLMALSSYIIPAGVYDRVAIEVPGGGTRMVVDAKSYHVVESKPVGLLGIFMSIPQGFAEAATVIAVTFCVGGAFGVVKKTGAISVGVAALARKMSRKGIMIIPVLMVVFSAIAAFIGTQELALVYVPIIMPLILALGFDSLTAAAVALCATTAGFTGAITNPFTVGIAQKIAEVPLYSGSSYRFLVLIVLTTSTTLYVMRYASKVRNDPSKSLMRDIDMTLHRQSMGEENADLTATRSQILAGGASIILFAWMILGVLVWKWEMIHMGGMLLAIGLVAGLLGGLNPNEICRAFEEGFGEVLLGAMIMGVARGVAVVMAQGQIIDTVIHAMAQMIQNIPPSINAVGMFIVQSAFNFLVSSGSGQAVITMPIMAPLADIVGVSRQVSILAFQLGDGLSNVIYPTSGYFMAVLAMSKIPWNRWLRFMLPLFLLQSFLGSIFLVAAQMFGWQ